MVSIFQRPQERTIQGASVEGVAKPRMAIQFLMMSMPVDNDKCSTGDYLPSLRLEELPLI